MKNRIHSSLSNIMTSWLSSDAELEVSKFYFLCDIVRGEGYRSARMFWIELYWKTDWTNFNSCPAFSAIFILLSLFVITVLLSTYVPTYNLKLSSPINCLRKPSPIFLCEAKLKNVSSLYLEKLHERTYNKNSYEIRHAWWNHFFWILN